MAIKAAGLSRLAKSLQKAACVQATYQHGKQGVPLAAPGDLVHPEPLNRETPDSLKICIENVKEKSYSQ